MRKTTHRKKVSENFYGLTDREIEIVKKKPIVCAQAYAKSWEAESTCGRLYKVSDTNDESDACRHFLWAGLLTKEFERDQAEEILNAHEQNPLQPEEEKSMDLANNRLGISVAEKLLKKKCFSVDHLLEEFKNELSAGNLIVIKKGKR